MNSLKNNNDTRFCQIYIYLKVSTGNSCRFVVLLLYSVWRSATDSNHWVFQLDTLRRCFFLCVLFFLVPFALSFISIAIAIANAIAIIGLFFSVFFFLCSGCFSAFNGVHWTKKAMQKFTMLNNNNTRDDDDENATITFSVRFPFNEFKTIMYRKMFTKLAWINEFRSTSAGAKSTTLQFARNFFLDIKLNWCARTLTLMQAWVVFIYLFVCRCCCSVAVVGCVWLAFATVLRAFIIINTNCNIVDFLA